MNNTMQHYTDGIRKVIPIKEVLMNLETSFDELVTTLQPMIDKIAAHNLSKESGFEVFNSISKVVKTKLGKDMFSTIKMVSLNLSQNEEKIVKMVTDLLESVRGSEIIIDAADFKTIYILRYTENLGFFINYSEEILCAMIQEELLSIDKGLKLAPIDKFNLNEVKDENKRYAFARAIELLQTDPEEIKLKLSKLTGRAYSESELELNNATDNIENVDPLRFGLIPVMWNPFYRVALVINEWRANRYHKNVEMVERLKNQLTMLEMKKNHTTDPIVLKKLQEQIDYHSNRMNKYLTKIQEAEE